jgi:hypothetical protein
VVGDEPLIRDIQAGLKNTGLSILDVEAVWLAPDTDVERLIPTLKTGQRLGARGLAALGGALLQRLPRQVAMKDAIWIWLTHFADSNALCASHGRRPRNRCFPNLPTNNGGNPC